MDNNLGQAIASSVKHAHGKGHKVKRFGIDENGASFRCRLCGAHAHVSILGGKCRVMGSAVNKYCTK